MDWWIGGLVDWWIGGLVDWWIGVNLPIVVDNEIVGVIGITGEKERVSNISERPIS